MQKLLFWLDKKGLRYGLLAILMVVALLPKFPFLKIPGTYVSIRLEDFLILTVFIVWTLITYKKVGEIFKNELNQAIFMFIGIGLLSLISGILLSHSVSPHIGLFHWLRRIEYFSVFLIGTSVVRNREDVNLFVKSLCILVFLIFVYGVGQKYLYWPIVTTQNYEYSKGIALRYTPGAHINSTFAGHYDLASFLIMILPIFFAYLFTAKDRLSKAVFIIAIMSGLWLLVNTISRISILSYLGGITFAIFLIKKYKAIPLVILASLVYISLSSDLVNRYTRVFEVTIKRVRQLENRINFKISKGLVYAREDPVPTPPPVFEDRSTSIRLNVEWPRAIRAFIKNPLLGTGFSSITLATDSEYLRLLGEVGIIGFLSFFLIFVRMGTVFKTVIPKISGSLNSAYLAGVIGSIPGVFLNAVFIDVFEASKFAIVFWILIGMAVSLIINVKSE